MFRVFGDDHTSAEAWATSIEAYLQHIYHSVEDICSHFHAFLNPQQFSSWIFAQDETTWMSLKKKFIEKALDIEFEYHKLAIEKEEDFQALCVKI